MRLNSNNLFSVYIKIYNFSIIF